MREQSLTKGQVPAQRWRSALGEELGVGSVAWGVVVVNTLVRLFPEGMAGRLRALLYRRAGISIGPRTVIRGQLLLRGDRSATRNLVIGSDCLIYPFESVDCCASVQIGNHVTFGPQVAIITGSHEIHDPGHRAGALVPLPVRVEDGAWVCLGATLLPGVTVGRGAVVAARAVVTRDVPPHTLVAGSPARVIRKLNTVHERGEEGAAA